MVGYADSRRSEVGTQLFEVVVAQFASGHLDAYMVQVGVCAGIEVGTMQWHACLLAEFYDKLFVALAFLSPQMEVAMGGLYPIA